MRTARKHPGGTAKQRGAQEHEPSRFSSTRRREAAASSCGSSTNMQPARGARTRDRRGAPCWPSMFSATAPSARDCRRVGRRLGSGSAPRALARASTCTVAQHEADVGMRDQPSLASNHIGWPRSPTLICETTSQISLRLSLGDAHAASRRVPAMAERNIRLGFAPK